MKKIVLLIFPVLFTLYCDAQNAQSYLDSGSYYLNNKRFEDAIISLTKCIETDNEEIEAYAYRAFAFYNMLQFEKAMEDCNKALGINEGYAEMYNLRALCKEQLGNRQGACNDWQTAYYYGFNDALRMIKKFCNQNLPVE
jgi:tetratricopeptide (TPR) repeat protein